MSDEVIVTIDGVDSNIPFASLGLSFESTERSSFLDCDRSSTCWPDKRNDWKDE